MNQLTDPVFVACKAAVASVLAVLLVRYTATNDALSAGFVALVCTSPSVHAGLRRGLEQVLGSLLGALLGGLPQALTPAAHGAPWALLPGMTAALLLCFRLGLGSSYVVVGFTVLYFHTLPFASPGQALEARGLALAAGIGSAVLVNAVVSAVAGPRITARRLALARGAVAAALRGLAARIEKNSSRPPSFEAAFDAVAELHRDLASSAHERLFPGALRTRISALAGISHAVALEEAAHLGKEAALLADGCSSPQPLAPLLTSASAALEAGMPASLAGVIQTASDEFSSRGELALASVARRLGQSVERGLSRATSPHIVNDRS